MNIMYMAPRYHTNQAPIVKGWIECGHKVKFISQYRGATESYKYLEPEIIGYSKAFLLINKIYSILRNRDLKTSANMVAFQVKFGFPPIHCLTKKMKEFNPDVVIIRERSVYSMFAYCICKKLKRKAILYNQTPLWEEKPEKKDFLHRFVKALTPKIRITPVLGKPEKKGYKSKDSYFVPFVMEPKITKETKKHFLNGKINLICIGKFEERKNHLMLLQIFKELKSKYPIALTLIGEVSTLHHKQYFEKVENFVIENFLEEDVIILKNITVEEVYENYLKADLFILPSTQEMASISQLEAMSCALPIICSDTNGTACYVEQGINGFLFKDGDKNNLLNLIESMILDTDCLLCMGEKSLKLVEQKYSFDFYKQKIEAIIK